MNDNQSILCKLHFTFAKTTPRYQTRLENNIPKKQKYESVNLSKEKRRKKE